MRPLGRLLTGVCLASLVAGAAWADRFALVVGVGDYAKIADAPGATRDASNIATALTDLEFEVTVLTNPTHQGLDPMLTAFASRLSEAETVVVYFAGHAIQSGGQNYLLASDAGLDSVTRLGEESWTIDELLTQLTRRVGQQTIVLLDTSRPLETVFADAPGLAAMTPEKGVYLASAAQPGKLAQAPEEGDRSLFTAALLTHLGTEGISVSDMMARVRGEVARLTDEAQIPWARSNLTAQVYIKPVVEDGTVITAADLETWGSLDEASRDRLMAALGRNGVLLEIVEVDEEDTEGTDVASVEPGIGEIGLVIEDLDDPVGDPTAVAATATGADSTGTVPGAAGSTAVASVDPSTTTTPTPTNADPAQDATGGPELPPADLDTDTAVQTAAVDIPDDLPRAIQQELTRVGCHRSVIDGIWGRVSTVSLLRYYAGRGELTEEQAKGQPTADAYTLLKAEEGVVCEGVIAPAVRTASAGTTRTVAKPKTSRVVVKQSSARSTSSSSSRSTQPTRKIQRSVTTTGQDGDKKVRTTIMRGVFQ